MVVLFPRLQRGYIDGPILTTFHTNLVVLPAVMEYMQYGLIALGLAIIIIAAVVHHRVKVRTCLDLPACSLAFLKHFLTACCDVPHLLQLTALEQEGLEQKKNPNRFTSKISGTKPLNKSVFLWLLEI